MRRLSRILLLAPTFVLGAAALGEPHAVLRPPAVHVVSTAMGSVDPRDGRARRRDIRAIQRTLRKHEAGTYIGEMLLERDSSLARWPDRREEPVRVWVDASPRLSSWSPTLALQVRSAFKEWESSGIPVHFDFVDDSLDAEVMVRWTDRFEEPISGRTRWARDDAWWITDAVITLAVHHHKGELLDDEAMRAMALHEIGHLLGLDHTTDPGSIMAPRVRVRSLTTLDRATARLLYQLPAGTVRAE